MSTHEYTLMHSCTRPHMLTNEKVYDVVKDLISVESVMRVSVFNIFL